MANVTAHHRVITDECRANRGDEGALDEALATSRAKVIDLYKHWPRGKSTKVHIKVEVDYPDDD